MNNLTNSEDQSAPEPSAAALQQSKRRLEGVVQLARRCMRNETVPTHLADDVRVAVKNFAVLHGSDTALDAAARALAWLDGERKETGLSMLGHLEWALNHA